MVFPLSRMLYKRFLFVDSISTTFFLWKYEHCEMKSLWQKILVLRTLFLKLILTLSIIDQDNWYNLRLFFFLCFRKFSPHYEWRISIVLFIFHNKKLISIFICWLNVAFPLIFFNQYCWVCCSSIYYHFDVWCLVTGIWRAKLRITRPKCSM